MKLLEINNCSQCHHREGLSFCGLVLSGLNKHPTKIKIDGIPEWCPLPNCEQIKEQPAISAVAKIKVIIAKCTNCDWYGLLSECSVCGYDHDRPLCPDCGQDIDSRDAIQQPSLQSADKPEGEMTNDEWEKVIPCNACSSDRCNSPCELYDKWLGENPTHNKPLTDSDAEPKFLSCNKCGNKNVGGCYRYEDSADGCMNFRVKTSAVR